MRCLLTIASSHIEQTQRNVSPTVSRVCAHLVNGSRPNIHPPIQLLAQFSVDTRKAARRSVELVCLRLGAKQVVHKQLPVAARNDADETRETEPKPEPNPKQRADRAAAASQSSGRLERWELFSVLLCSTSFPSHITQCH